MNRDALSLVELAVLVVLRHELELEPSVSDVRIADHGDRGRETRGTEGWARNMSIDIERVFLPSAIRRGREQTSPTFAVSVPGYRYFFRRRKDAQRFVEAGGVCPEHERIYCNACNGWRYAAPPTGSEGSKP